MTQVIPVPATSEAGSRDGRPSSANYSDSTTKGVIIWGLIMWSLVLVSKLVTTI
jgi:hypothetical protein